MFYVCLCASQWQRGTVKEYKPLWAVTFAKMTFLNNTFE